MGAPHIPVHKVVAYPARFARPVDQPAVLALAPPAPRRAQAHRALQGRQCTVGHVPTLGGCSARPHDPGPARPLNGRLRGGKNH